MENEQEVTVVENNEENKTFDALIEDKRAPLFKQFAKNRKISNVLTTLILICAIGGMILITGGQTWMTILGWSILGAGFVAMLIFYFTSKKKFDTNTREYLSFVNETLNKETFSDSNFTNIETTDSKLEISDFVSNGVYGDIVKVASRNIINGKYGDISFKYAEAAVYKKTDNKRQPAVAVFVGKFFEADNQIKFGGNFVINISREEPIDAPNNVENRTILYQQDGMTIYGDEGADFRAVIGEQFLGNVKKIKAEEHLLNCAISIWEGHTFVFMSYDDAVIALPFDKPLDAEAFNSFTVDLKNVFNVLTLLGK